MEIRAGGASSDDSMQRLTVLVPPPTAGGNSVDWAAASSTYEHAFPDDYRQFMASYGQGSFDNFLTVYPPMQEVYPNDRSATVLGLTADARSTGEEEDFAVPEQLIGWGLTQDSDLLCWRSVDQDPNRWTTVIWRRQWAPPDSWMEFDCGMVELLVRYVDRQIEYFSVPGLPYRGSRFLHTRDAQRFRRMRIDPWGPEPVAG
ncbi:SMI1/KNR4 family protein [Streptacidiphilus cavernicola]|uniref:SMI1/KNR4 family protein n=1 Tax=Streptacidiphilus cavernicola TaxID=3342716 RepID=A0ABV6W2J6_9ACTN